MSEFTSVEGKVAIVNGCAQGIGAGAARKLAEEGCIVVMGDIKEKVKETFEEIKKDNPGLEGFAKIVDVSKEEDVKAIVEETVEKYGRLDIMYNNAGIHIETGNVYETPEETIDKILAVNFKGMFFGCKHAAKQMKKQESGTIVNTGSFFGKVGHAESATYGASKGAVHTMTQALSLEMAEYNVNVNALCPGLAASEMHWAFVEADAEKRGISFEEMKEVELEEIPLSRYGYGKDMAGAVIWLASEAGSYVTGQLINVNGGLDFS